MLIILLLRWINIPDMFSLLKNVNLYYFILLLALITCDRIFMAYKWHLLLRIKDMSISVFSVIRTYYIATFIGFFLPTTVGGDMVRVLKLRSEKRRGTDVLSSVILERILGFIASAILAPIAALFLISFFKLNIWRFLGIAGAFLFLFTILMVISFSEVIVRKIDKNEKLSKNFLFNKLKKLYLSYAEYKNHKGVLVLFLALSILEQLAPVIGNYLACRALNLSIPFIYFLLIIPLVQLISRIPISFEGIGVNEGLLVYFFALLGLSKTGAFTIGLLGHIAIIIATLPALFFYIKDIKTSLYQSRHGN
ncbi:MAG: flippase-like domain-containing protein [Chloroflexi bacterium]|nr:flippase-like domain-containing protein [Chloroflexota bacterium]MBE3114143.1 flippase-like domain-containing protein [Actinomycetota bacterium]